MSFHDVVCRCARSSIALIAAAALLAGCAGQGPGAEAPRADLATTSDQTQARNRALIRLELAVGYFQQGQTTVALDELKLSIAADPTFADAYNLRGLVYMRMSEDRLAEDSFRRALQLAPRDGNILHNYGWLLCQQRRYADSYPYFTQAIASPQYGEQSKTFMTLGICQQRGGQLAEAERSLMRSYELDPGNAYTGQQLAALLMARGDLQRAQFYMRRINNSDQATAESLWLGMKVERRAENRDAMLQLGMQLKRRFPNSREALAYDRGAWDE